MTKHNKRYVWRDWYAAALCGQIGEDWRCMCPGTGPDGDPSAANYSHSVRLTGTFCRDIHSSGRICGSHKRTDTHTHTHMQDKFHIPSQIISGNNFMLSGIKGRTKAAENKSIFNSRMGGKCYERLLKPLRPTLVLPWGNKTSPGWLECSPGSL